MTINKAADRCWKFADGSPPEEIPEVWCRHSTPAIWIGEVVELSGDGVPTMSLRVSGSKIAYEMSEHLSVETALVGVHAQGNLRTQRITRHPDQGIYIPSTSEQLRLGYDSSNYASWTASSVGQANFVATGVGSAASLTITPTSGQRVPIQSCGLCGKGSDRKFVYCPRCGRNGRGKMAGRLRRFMKAILRL